MSRGTVTAFFSAHFSFLILYEKLATAIVKSTETFRGITIETVPAHRNLKNFATLHSFKLLA